MADQSELTRRRRLMRGACPTHGIALVQCGVALDEYGEPCGPRVECPRRDCDFEVNAPRGSKLYRALHPETPK